MLGVDGLVFGDAVFLHWSGGFRARVKGAGGFRCSRVRASRATVARLSGFVRFRGHDFGICGHCLQSAHKVGVQQVVKQIKKIVGGKEKAKATPEI